MKFIFEGLRANYKLRFIQIVMNLKRIKHISNSYFMIQNLVLFDKIVNSYETVYIL